MVPSNAIVALGVGSPALGAALQENRNLFTNAATHGVRVLDFLNRFTGSCREIPNAAGDIQIFVRSSGSGGAPAPLLTAAAIEQGLTSLQSWTGSYAPSISGFTGAGGQQLRLELEVPMRNALGSLLRNQNFQQAVAGYSARLSAQGLEHSQLVQITDGIGSPAATTALALRGHSLRLEEQQHLRPFDVFMGTLHDLLQNNVVFDGQGRIQAINYDTSAAQFYPQAMATWFILQAATWLQQQELGALQGGGGANLQFNRDIVNGSGRASLQDLEQVVCCSQE